MRAGAGISGPALNKMMESFVKKFVETQSDGHLGEFLPLSVWATKGYDANDLKNIKKNGNHRFDEVSVVSLAVLELVPVPYSTVIFLAAPMPLAAF